MENKISAIDGGYKFKTENICVEMLYAKNGTSFNKCILNILKLKTK